MPVRFVHNDQVPVNLPKARQDIFTLGQIERSDNLLLFQPLVHAELVADIAALHHEEFLVELFFKFPLPLKREIRRADDQDSLGEPA